jgi:hypothetical protein
VESLLGKKLRDLCQAVPADPLRAISKTCLSQSRCRALAKLKGFDKGYAEFPAAEGLKEEIRIGGWQSQLF